MHGRLVRCIYIYKDPSLSSLPSKVDALLVQTPHFWEIMGYVEDEIQALESDEREDLGFWDRRAYHMALGSLASYRQELNMRLERRFWVEVLPQRREP